MPGPGASLPEVNERSERASAVWVPLTLVACLALAFFAWDSVALLPLKLLAVMAHETGHALASLLVGGSVNQVTLRPNESGSCLSQIPVGFLGKVAVSSGGYVGNALISAVLLVLTIRFRAGRPLAIAAAAWLGLVALLYARDLFTLGFAAGFAVVFGLAARLLPQTGLQVLNLFLATFNSVYAARDLFDDLWNGQVRSQSDAQILADGTGVPALAWAAAWTALALLVLAVGARAAFGGAAKVRSAAASGAPRSPAAP